MKRIIAIQAETEIVRGANTAPITNRRQSPSRPRAAGWPKTLNRGRSRIEISGAPNRFAARAVNAPFVVHRKRNATSEGRNPDVARVSAYFGNSLTNCAVESCDEDLATSGGRLGSHFGCKFGSVLSSANSDLNMVGS